MNLCAPEYQFLVARRFQYRPIEVMEHLLFSKIRYSVALFRCQPHSLLVDIGSGPTIRYITIENK